MRNLPPTVELALKGELQVPSVLPTPAPTQPPATPITPAPTEEEASAQPGFPWQRDGLTPYEAFALAVFDQLDEWSDPAIVQEISGAAWLADDITDEEVSALLSLRSIGLNDAVGGMILASYLVPLERVDKDAVEASRTFAADALENLPYPESLLRLPFMEHGLSQEELEAMPVFAELASIDSSLLDRLIETPWFADGITRFQMEVVEHISRLAAVDLSLVEQLLDTPWVADGITRHEMEVVEHISRLAAADLSLVEQLLDTPWVADGITAQEVSAIGFAGTKAALDAGLKIYGGEWYTLGRLALRRGIVSMEPTLELDELHLNWAFTGSMLSITPWNQAWSQDRVRRLGNELWFQDGLTNEEKALVVALETVVRADDLEEVFQELSDSASFQSTGFTLPLVGEVNLFAVSRSSLGQNNSILAEMRTGMEAIEDFIQLPWPQLNVIALLEPAHTQYKGKTAGFYVGSHMVAKTYSDRTVYHELGHYYFNSKIYPSWLHAGAADFLAGHTLALERPTSLQNRYNSARNRAARRCSEHGVADVHEWIQATS